MNSIPTFIKAAEVILPIGEDLHQAFTQILAKKRKFEFKKLPTGEEFPCMIFEQPIGILEGSLKVANKLKDKLGFREFNPDTQLIFTTTKGDIEAKDFKNKKLWVTAQDLAKALNLTKEPIVVSCACISGVSGVGLASQLISIGTIESALVVGADLVSEFIYSGFYSFKAISTKPCKPYHQERDGLNLGEGFAAIYLDSKSDRACAKVCGFAESNDANHISGPSRDGEGLRIAMEKALRKAGVKVSEIDAVSSHGTATVYNDEMESIAYSRMEINAPVTSFKAYTGHTLGAAGLIEIALCTEAMQTNIWPSHIDADNLGVSGKIHILKENSSIDLNCILKTASGFGGCNAALVLKKCS